MSRIIVRKFVREDFIKLIRKMRARSNCIDVKMNVDEIIEKLESLGSKKNVEGMEKYGITSKARILGIPKPELRKIAKIM